MRAFCCVPELWLCLVVFCLWYAHGGGEPEQQNLPSHPIPPLQVEECALWQAFTKKVSHLKDPQSNRDPRLIGLPSHERIVCAESYTCVIVYSMSPEMFLRFMKTQVVPQTFVNY